MIVLYIIGIIIVWVLSLVAIGGFLALSKRPEID